jgi:hypothetical protein
MRKSQKENRDFFNKFPIARVSGFYTVEAQLDMIKKFEKDIKLDWNYYFDIFGAIIV